MTYRYRGHSVADAGLSYRTRDETGAWIDKDPIALLRQRLLGEGMSEEELVVRRLAARLGAAGSDMAPSVLTRVPAEPDARLARHCRRA
jgi:TPP-dependent pyruvate/acetoin dehydrogenase alpha subunit